MLYDYRCTHCGAERLNVHNSIANRKTNAPECCGDKMTIIITAAPMGFVDREIHYKCPVTNQEVTSRRQRNEIMARNNLMDANDFKDSIKKKMRKSKQEKARIKKEQEQLPSDLKRAFEGITKDAEKKFKSGL